MSTYSQRYGLIGAVIGGIIGYFIPVVGWALGAYLGYVIGYYIGGYVDARKADVKVPGRPVDDLQIPSNTIGAPIYDGLGTVKVSSGQLLFYGRNRAVPVYQRVKVSSKKKKTVLVGYKYYMSWGIGILAGPVDCLYTIIRDHREVVWEGKLARPTSGQSVTIELEGIGKAQFFFGTGEQTAWPDVANVIPDPNLNIPYRGLCWAYFQDCFLGERNRLPILSFIVRKTPILEDFPAEGYIAPFDYNPMCMVWYILRHLSGLPATWLHSTDFFKAAYTLVLERKGLSLLLESSQPAELWLESINLHIDNILRYGSDGKFHPKLLRYDYDINDLPEIKEQDLLEKPNLTRRSWIDTVNEVRVQYSHVSRTVPEEFIYVGISAHPYGPGGKARILRINKSKFKVEDQLIYNVPEEFAFADSFFCSFTDFLDGYAYFGYGSYGGPVVRVDIEGFLKAGRLPFIGTDGPRSVVFDKVNRFAYFGTGGHIPFSWWSYIHKVRLSDFTVVASIGGVSTRWGALYTAEIDPVAGYAYFGESSYVSSRVIRIKLSDFSVDGTISLPYYPIGSSAIDVPRGYIYFASSTNPVRIHKIKLSTFTIENVLSMENFGYTNKSAVVDSEGGFLYIASNNENKDSKIAKIRLIDFAVVQVREFPLNKRYDCAIGMLLDPPEGALYLGFRRGPGVGPPYKIAKVRLFDLAVIKDISLSDMGTPVTITGVR